jgi:TRAP transporter TAXI family solute receptor
MPTRDPVPPSPDGPVVPSTRRSVIERIADRFHISPREALIALLPVVLLLVLVGWVAQRFVRPAPPSTISMTTGMPGGAYDAFAKRYRDILARSGVTLVLHPSSGAVENFDRLRAARGKHGEGDDVGFMQSGTGSPAEAPNLETIAGIYYEPVWLVARDIETLPRLSHLRGKRIGVGVRGTGSQALVLRMLGAAGVSSDNTALSELPAQDAIASLQEGRLDVMFFVGAPEAPLVQAIFASALKLVSLGQSEAIARKFPVLIPLVLPQGAIDLATDRPGRDVRLVVGTSTLVARDDLHPALVYLLLEAAAEIHGGPGLLAQRGEFPSARVQNFPLSAEAARWFKSGRPFLQRYLPFWLANLIERLLVVIVPIIALMIPLMRVVPALYSWRVRSKVFRWYGEVRAIEARAHDGHRDGTERRAERRRLDDIEEAVNHLKIPLSFYHEVHLLRAHIEMVRRHLDGDAGGHDPGTAVA